MENSLWPALFVVAVLLGGGIMIRRSYGRIGADWYARLENAIKLRPGQLVKAVFFMTLRGWFVVWFAVDEQQREDLARYFKEMGPWTVTDTDAPAAPDNASGGQETGQ